MSTVDDTAPLERLRELLRARIGLAFAPARSQDLERGVRRAMACARIASLSDYVTAIESGRVGADELIAELTIRETYFFREPHQLAFLRREALPSIVRIRGPRHVFRIWSAGCASGEEPYTLAIVLEQEGLAERSHVLGTDICSAALVEAEKARYRSWSLRAIQPDLVGTYFHRDGEHFVLEDRVRRRVMFERHNVAVDPAPPRGGWLCDVILCRNVLIYLDRAGVDAVAARLFEWLAPGGWLFTGPSDPLLTLPAPFETVITKGGVLYRRPPGLAVPAPEPLASEASVEPCMQPVEPPSAPACERPRGTHADTHDEEARSAYARGDWSRVVEVASQPGADAALCALGVRAAANLRERDDVERLCAARVAEHPLSVELRYLHALLLAELGRSEEAVASAKCAIYLDRRCVVAHFLLASLLHAQGDRGGAARAYRNVRDLSAGRPRGELVPLAEGARAGQLADASEARLRAIAPATEAR